MAEGRVQMDTVCLTVGGFFPTTYGGGQTYLDSLAKGLRERGYNAVVVTSAPWAGGVGPYQIGRYEWHGTPVTSLAVNPAAIRLETPYAQVGGLLEDALSEALSEIAPSLVHANGLKAIASRVCARLGTPFVVTAHHAGFVCPAGTLLRPDDSICEERAGPRVCVPCCLKHKAGQGAIGRALGVVPPFLYRPIGRIVGRRVSAPYLLRGLAYPAFVEASLRDKSVVLDSSCSIVCPSRALADHLCLNGVSPERLKVIPHGVERVGAGAERRSERKAVAFGYVGMVNRAKGLHVLLRALETLSARETAELHVFGVAQHPWEQRYLTSALEAYRGSSRVVRHGLIPRERIAEIYAAIDVLVVPSLCFEVFGLVVLEAQSAGVPAIVSDSGGLTELVKDGETGFVAQRNNPAELAAAMRRFLDDRSLAPRMGARIGPVRTLQEHLDDLLEEYRRVMGKEPHTAGRVRGAR